MPAEQNPQPTPPLYRHQDLVQRIKNHWRGHPPEADRELSQKGKLDLLAGDMAMQTRTCAETLQSQGLDKLTAWNEAMRDVALSMGSQMRED